MTNEQTRSIQDDIAYMRAMTAEGSRATLLSGEVLVAAGVIFGGATIAHWAGLRGYLPIREWGIMALWVAAGLVFAAVLGVLIRRHKNQPGSEAPANKAVSAAWSALGLTIFTMWLGITVASVRTENWLMFGLFPVLILSVYGSAWMVAAIMSRLKWIGWVAVASFVLAVATAWFTGEEAQYLVYGVSLILVTILPGLALMRRQAQA